MAKITIEASDLASDVLARVNAGVQVISQSADQAAGSLSSFASLVQDGVSAALHNASQEAENAGEAIKGAFENPQEALRSFGSALKDQVLSMLGPGLSEAVAIGLAALSAVTVAVMELGQHATEVGAEIEKIAMVSNVSASGISNLKFAMEAAGGSADQLGTMMFMFEKRMDTSSDAVDKGLKQIGLSLSAVADMSSDQRILAISTAFKNSGDDVNRASAAFEIFGKQGRDMLPQLMQDLSGLADKSRELGNTWSDDDAKAAHDFAVAVKTMATESASAWTQLGRDLAPITNEIALGWDRMKLAIANVALTVGDVVSGFGYFHAAWATFFGDADQLPKVSTNLKGLADGSGLAAKGVKDWSDSVATRAAASPSLQAALATESSAGQDLTDSVNAQIKAHQDAVAAAQQFEDAVTNVTIAEGGYAGVVASLNGTVLEAIRNDLLHKASIQDITRMYDVQVATIRVIEQELKSEAEAAKTSAEDRKRVLAEVQKVEEAKNAYSLKALEDLNVASAKANKTSMDDTLKSIDATEKLWVDYYDRVDQATLSSVDYKKLKVKEWFDNEVLKLKDDDANWMAHYDALYATAQQKTAEITAQSDKYVQDTKKLLADLSDGPGGWVDTFSSILVHSGSFKDAVKGVWTELKGDTLNIFSDLLSSIIHGFLDELLHQVEEYVAKMLVKLAVLTVLKFFSFGLFSGGGVAGTGGGDTGEGASYAAQGGTIGRSGVVYAADGWMQPRGTDTVPAMLTPGERVLTVQDTQDFDRVGGVNALRGGQMSSSGSSGLEGRIDALHATIKRQGDQLAALMQLQPTLMRHALRGTR